MEGGRREGGWEEGRKEGRRQTKFLELCVSLCGGLY